MSPPKHIHTHTHAHMNFLPEYCLVYEYISKIKGNICWIFKKINSMWSYNLFFKTRHILYPNPKYCILLLYTKRCWVLLCICNVYYIYAMKEIYLCSIYDLNSPCWLFTIDLVFWVVLPFQVEYSTLNACGTYSVSFLSVLILYHYMYKDQWFSKWRWRNGEVDGKINRIYVCRLVLWYFEYHYR